MLIGFTFNNFCSFNIESEFSMEAPTGKVKARFPDNYTSTDAEYDLLKTAVRYQVQTRTYLQLT